jgi:hypothetical protein
LKIKLAYAIIIVIVTSIIFSILFYYFEYHISLSNGFSKNLANDVVYNKTAIWQMHDVIVDGKIIAFTNDPKPNIILQVNKYYKHPQNATHLTIWGDFGLNSDYCMENYSECGNDVVAYLYKDKNGIYRQGETFGRVTDSCDVKCITGVR